MLRHVDDVKGQAASGSNREGESTEAGRRGGAARSSEEGPVMGLERRGCVVRPWPLANRKREEPMDEAKPFKQRLNIGSRVTREGHARFWERPEVKFLRATRRLEPIVGVRANGWNRRISLVAGRPGEGPLTKPITATQPRRQEPLFMPPLRPLPAPPHNRAVGCGQLVIRFGFPEDKSEVSYFSQFQQLNATGSVWLNP